MGILADNDLKPKQVIFADTYIANGFNGVQAAREAGYSGNDATLRAIASENLTKPNIQRYIASRTSHIKVKADKRIIKAREEFAEQLEFAKEMRTAARQWLNVNGVLDLDPRADEITVVYDDLDDLDKQGKPKQKKAPLKTLMEQCRSDYVAPHFAIVKTVDLRKLALEAINTADTVIAQFAKMDGDYTQDKKNPHDNKTIIEETIRELMAENIPEEQIREVLAERYPETVH